MEARQIDNKHNNPPSDLEILKDSLKSKHEPILDEARSLVEKSKTLLTLTPQISDEELCGEFSDMVKQITASIKKLEGTRTAEKEPYLAGGRTVDSFFKVVTDHLEKTKQTLNKPITLFLQQKAAEERRKAQAEAEEKRKESEAQFAAAAQAEEAGLQRQAENSLVKAQVTSDQANQLAAQAKAPAAELSRTRGSESQAGLRTRWKGQVVDRNNLDLEALRSHFTDDDLQKAVNKFVAIGGRNLKGASIYEDSTASIR